MNHPNTVEVRIGKCTFFAPYESFREMMLDPFCSTQAAMSTKLELLSIMMREENRCELAVSS